MGRREYGVCVCKIKIQAQSYEVKEPVPGLLKPDVHICFMGSKSPRAYKLHTHIQVAIVRLCPWIEGTKFCLLRLGGSIYLSSSCHPFHLKETVLRVLL